MNPSQQSSEKLKSSIEDWIKYGDNQYKSSLDLLKRETNSFYHLDCYKSIINKTNLQRCKNRFLKQQSIRENMKNTSDDA